MRPSMACTGMVRMDEPGIAARVCEPVAVPVDPWPFGAVHPYSISRPAFPLSEFLFHTIPILHIPFTILIHLGSWEAVVETFRSPSNQPSPFCHLSSRPSFIEFLSLVSTKGLAHTYTPDTISLSISSTEHLLASLVTSHLLLPRPGLWYLGFGSHR